MAMRNFWLEGYIDGRESELSGSPRGKDAGMEVVIRQKDGGRLVKAYTISSYVDAEGNLITKIYDNNGDKVSEFKTER